MANYLVTYSETLSKTLLVEAESAEAAAARVEDAFDAGGLKLRDVDYVGDSATIETECANEGDQGWYDDLDELLGSATPAVGNRQGEATDKELFKQMFGEYCRGEVSKGNCAADDCLWCAVNMAWGKIFCTEEEDGDEG